MSLKIKFIYAYEVLDSRGHPTVAAIARVGKTIAGSKEVTAKAMVPSGASTGEKEALELRDGDTTRYNGKGVKKAVMNINNFLAPQLIAANLDAENQGEIDKFLIAQDGTENKSVYGANAILAISLAVAKAVALYNGTPFYQYIRNLMYSQENLSDSNFKYTLPVPMVNVINGGEHADNTIDFQEFMFMPVGAKSMHEAVRIASECFHSLQKILHNLGLNTAKGDEGGFAPNLASAEEALSLMMKAIVEAGYRPGVKGGQVALALDCAASELYDEDHKVYVFKKALAAGLMNKEEAVKTTNEMIKYLKSLVDQFPIISIEDGLDQNDWYGFKKLVEEIGSHVQIVGDDLFCTNPKLTVEGVERAAANAVLIKVNQIGTLTETLETISIARKAGWSWVLSHRSGETEDTSIADIAVGTSSGQIKTGSMSRSERIAKYNRLLEIEIELNKAHSAFKGLHSFTNLDVSNDELFKVVNYNLDHYKQYLSSDKKAKESSSKIKSKKKVVKILAAKPRALLMANSSNSKRGRPRKGLLANQTRSEAKPENLVKKISKVTVAHSPKKRGRKPKTK